MFAVIAAGPPNLRCERGSARATCATPEGGRLGRPKELAPAGESQPKTSGTRWRPLPPTMTTASVTGAQSAIVVTPVTSCPSQPPHPRGVAHLSARTSPKRTAFAVVDHGRLGPIRGRRYSRRTPIAGVDGVVWYRIWIVASRTPTLRRAAIRGQRLRCPLSEHRVTSLSIPAGLPVPRQSRSRYQRLLEVRGKADSGNRWPVGLAIRSS